MKKITIILFIIFICSFSYAEENENNIIDVIINKDVAIKYEDEYLRFYTSSKDDVYPITYLDSTYLPIRAISSLYEVPILWDGFNQTIYLDSIGQVDKNACEKVIDFTKDENIYDKAICNKTIRVNYKNEYVTFKDVNDLVIYPISYNDTTYLPVRAIANLFDSFVDYEFDTNTVLLGPSYKQYNDDTEFAVLNSDLELFKPFSGDKHIDFVVFNDKLRLDILLRKYDPITGKNLLEDEALSILEEIESKASGDTIKRDLLIQEYNLVHDYSDYDKVDDLYFGINGILVINGIDGTNDNRVKDIELIIDDDYNEIFTLYDTNQLQLLDVVYRNNTIIEPIKVTIKVLSTYEEDSMPAFSFFNVNYTSSIPQG